MDVVNNLFKYGLVDWFTVQLIEMCHPKKEWEKERKREREREKGRERERKRAKERERIRERERREREIYWERHKKGSENYMYNISNPLHIRFY